MLLRTRAAILAAVAVCLATAFAPAAHATAAPGAHVAAAPPTVTVQGPHQAYDEVPFTLTAVATGTGPYTYTWHEEDWTNSHGQVHVCSLTGDHTASLQATCDYKYSSSNVYNPDFVVDVYSNGTLVATTDWGVAVGGPHAFLDQNDNLTSFTGRLMHDAQFNVPEANAAVDLQVRWAGTKAWRRYQSATTDRHGSARFTWTTDRPGRFRMHFAGDTDTRAVTSPSIFVRVPLRLRTAQRGLHVRVRLLDKITGKPAAGLPVRLDRLVGYDEVTVDRGRTSSRGVVHLTGDRTGSYAVGVPKTAKFDAWSRLLTLTD